MKKLLFLACFLAAPVWGFQGSSTFTVTLSTQGAGTRNCIQSMDTEASDTGANYTVRILSGDTTNFTLVVSTGSVFSKTWPEDNPFCGEINQEVILKNSGSSFNLNYQGFIDKVYE